MRDLIERYRATLATEPHPVRFVIARCLAKTGLCSRFRIRCDGFEMAFFPTAMSSALWVDPHHRREDTTFFRAYVKPGDTVIDAGANIGFLTLLAATLVGPEGRVHAIEPHPRTMRFLQANLGLNGFTNVAMHQTALGAGVGDVTFTDADLDDQNYVAGSGGAGLTVPMSTLDMLFASGTGGIALLKIDVEGYELEVLQGARRLLPRVACVYLESYDAHYARYGTSPGEVIRLLEAAGFQVFHRDAHLLHRIDATHGSPRYENLIAVRDAPGFEGRLVGSGLAIAASGHRVGPSTGR